MEDVLEVYQRPYDGNEVLVCMDETSKQQVKETRVPRPAAPGLSAAYDYEYERNGVSSLFMLFAPLDGWRRVEVRERRTKVDWAHVIKKLVDEDYPDRDRIVLVMDNLNTHKLSSLYEAFEPAEARRIAERLETSRVPGSGVRGRGSGERETTASSLDTLHSLRVLVEGIMDAEVSSGGAEYGERSPERVTQRNGYRSRAWEMDLHIPKLGVLATASTVPGPTDCQSPRHPARRGQWTTPTCGWTH